MINSFTKVIVCVAVLVAIGGFAQAGTIGYWQFNEQQPGGQTTGAAGEILDSSGNGHHGTAVGNPLPYYAAGYHDPPSAITLTRGSASPEDRIEVPHDNAFNFNLGAGDDFTLEAFIRTTDDVGRGIAIVTKRDTTGPGYNMGVFEGKVATYLESSDFTYTATVPRPAGVTNVADGEWHHVAVVIDADAAAPLNNVIKFYVDWVLDATVLIKDVSFGGTGIGEDLSNTHDVWIGDFIGRPGDQFVGDLDAVRISSGALTPGEFLTPIPEPSTVVLLAGLFGVGLMLLRRRQR